MKKIDFVSILYKSLWFYGAMCTLFHLIYHYVAVETYAFKDINSTLFYLIFIMGVWHYYLAMKYKRLYDDSKKASMTECGSGNEE